MVYLYPSVLRHLVAGGICDGCVATHLDEACLAIVGVAGGVVCDVVFKMERVAGNGPVVVCGGAVAGLVLAEVILSAEGCRGTGETVV